MGTTQRISPGVPGEPNWGALNRSITAIAKTVEKENETDQQENNGQTDETPVQEDIARRHKIILDRRSQHLKSAFNSLAGTGGGARSIAKGRSKSIGRAGLRSSQRIVSFLSAVGNKGLQQALEELGFNVEGKSVQDIVDFLLVYSSDSSAGMDETAANKAVCEVLNELAIEADNNFEAFEEIVRALTQGVKLSNLLCRFWGLYIFEHLSQRFLEKITGRKGQEIGSETFRIIKEDVLGQVKRLNDKRPVSKINWHGNQGKLEIENIFESIIKILIE